ncbi:MAG: SDR family NAD(P)-dependent oxidoreductase [Betaproteobacteria bacterium]|nr:SDR family NAD(P)-dependent oxidoreductase [Betaproteobacteria bacterium]
MADNRDTAVIVGVGHGLGMALAQRFARAEMNVVMAARNAAKLEALASEFSGIVHHTIAVACDATREADVEALFQRVGAELGPPRLVVYNAGAFVRKGILETTEEEFERCWRAGCLGGFFVGREAVRAMLGAKTGGRHRGTIIFTGATASLRGGANFHNLAVGKFGLRALAQSMAREFQPQGIHVAHVIIDGQIEAERPGRSVAGRGPDAVLSPAAIAESYYQLHLQPPSAWTLELDLRPYVEKF